MEEKESRQLSNYSLSPSNRNLSRNKLRTIDGEALSQLSSLREL